MTLELNKNKHVKFLAQFLKALPSKLANFDTNRLAITFFAISGLDILGALDILSEKKAHIINWIYSLQVLPTENSDESHGGFRGSPLTITGKEINHDKGNPMTNPYDSSHLAMTYTALATLIILGDDLSRVNRKAVVKNLAVLQQPNGSFICSLDHESDMRFVYCAACISYMLQDWSGVDIPLLLDFICHSWTYEGALGQLPDAEAHGGPTFCALASLYLLNQLDLTPKELSGLCRWSISRQMHGFQGRPNKPPDTCYSFWIGATLKMVDKFDLINKDDIRDFVLSTQDDHIGGFAKWVDTIPDPLHSYFGLGGLSLIGKDDLLPIHPALNITQRAFSHLQELHKRQFNSHDSATLP